MISFIQHPHIIQDDPLSYRELLELEVDKIRAFCAEHLSLCRDRGFNPSTQPMLQHISAVGVTVDSDGLYEDADSELILGSFLHLSNAGFVFDPDFEIDPLSFEVGRDILNEHGSTDVLIAAYLNDHGTRRTMFSNTEEWFYPHLEKVKAGEGQIANTTVSPKSYDPDAWSDKVIEAGVKVVVNNNECDLDPRRFRSEQYRIILPQERSWRSNPQDQSGKNGYVFQNDYIAAMMPTLNDMSPMSKRIKDTAAFEGLTFDSDAIGLDMA